MNRYRGQLHLGSKVKADQTHKKSPESLYTMVLQICQFYLGKMFAFSDVHRSWPVLLRSVVPLFSP